MKQMILAGAALLLIAVSTQAQTVNLLDHNLDRTRQISMIAYGAPEGLTVMVLATDVAGIKTITLTGNNGKKLATCARDICNYLWPRTAMKDGRNNLLTVTVVNGNGLTTATALTRVERPAGT